MLLYLHLVIEVNYNQIVIKADGCNDHKKVIVFFLNRFVSNKCVISKAIP